MAKSAVGEEINSLYDALYRLKRVVANHVANINTCKSGAKNFKSNPYTFYDYSPKIDCWDEEVDLTSEQKMYAYLNFFKEQLKVTENEIRKIKREIKELQRSQCIKEDPKC
jgi:hypothetical protein